MVLTGCCTHRAAAAAVKLDICRFIQVKFNDRASLAALLSQAREAGLAKEPVDFRKSHHITNKKLSFQIFISYKLWVL
jgi:hypothetical protein